MISKHFSWYLQKPTGEVLEDKIPSWLREIRSFRAQVLYEDGLRPNFYTKENYYDDPCDIDFYSFHIIAKKNNKIAGSIRITPLDNLLYSCGSEILGTDVFAQLLSKNNYNSQKLAEISRWTVNNQYKNTFLGFFLGLYSIYFINNISLNPIANGGNKIKPMLSLFGGKLFPQNPGPYFASKYNDEIFFIDIDITRAPEKVQRLFYKIRQQPLQSMLFDR